MKKVATCGSHELHRDGERLLFIDAGTGASYIGVYVFGLIGFITGANALAQLFVPRGSAVFALILTAISAVTLFAAWKLRGMQKAAAARKASPGDAFLVIDLEQRALLRGDGVRIAPLDGASFATVMQATSSSAGLELSYEGGSMMVARGSPFSGSVDDIVTVLKAAGLDVR